MGQPLLEEEMMTLVVIIRATRKLLTRLRERPDADVPASTTILGDWYANVLPWGRRQVALFVSEPTLLPVLMPLAPAPTLLGRFPDELAAVLHAHGVDESIINTERNTATDYRVTTTASRSVLGSMNDFAFLAEHARHSEPELDLLELSMQLSTVPCSPLYRRHISPDRELHALLNASTN